MMNPEDEVVPLVNETYVDPDTGQPVTVQVWPASEEPVVEITVEGTPPETNLKG